MAKKDEPIKKSNGKSVDKPTKVSHSRDELADLLHSSLNKQFKDYQVAYFLDGSEDSPTDLSDWVSTGSSLLDIAISNRPNAGLPVGRIIEITGLEASGKSLLAAHTLADTQRKDGVSVFIDSENAVSEEFLEAIGVDTEKLVYVQLETVEEIFAAIESIILKVRETNKNKLVTIIFDSVAAASCAAEAEADFSKDGYATGKAIIISKAMRKITNLIGKQKVLLIMTNQLRIKMGVSFGDPYCVDPYTTEVSITTPNYVGIEKLTLAQLSEKYCNNDDFINPEEFDCVPLDLKILSQLDDGRDVFVPIRSFVIKDSVDHYYTDGKLKGTGNHRIMIKGKEVYLKDHPDFKRVDEPMCVVDLEVDDTHTYMANDYLNHNTTSGGKAIGFHASVRLRLKSTGKIKGTLNGVEQIIGMTTSAQVVKNRVGPPHRTAEFDIYFDSGIDDLGGWFKVMKTYKIIEQSGMKYTYTATDGSGKIYTFPSKEFKTLVSNDKELRDMMYNSICEKFITKYKASAELDLDEVELAEDDPIIDD